MKTRHLCRCLGGLLILLSLGPKVNATRFAGGTGTPDDPYQIATAEHLIAIGQDPNLWTKCFALAADIDLDPGRPGGRVFDNALIAPDQNPSPNTSSGPSFHGVLDGCGHTIRNLCIDVTPGLNAGIFGMLGSGGIIMDLHIKDAKVQGSPAGIIAGQGMGGLIVKCSVSGQVVGPNDVGGILGSMHSGLLIQCHANVTVVGQDGAGGLCGILWRGQIIGSSVEGTVTGRKSIGGVAGNIIFEGIINQTQVNATITGLEQVGGLAGLCSGTIVESSTKGIVSGQKQVGGLIGLLSFANPMRASGVIRSASHCQVIGQQEVGGSDRTCWPCWMARYRPDHRLLCQGVDYRQRCRRPYWTDRWGPIDELLCSMRDGPCL